MKLMVKYSNKISELIKKVNGDELNKLNKVCESYAFRANEYYLSLINWDDPQDPIKRIIIPCEEELQEWGNLDASNEASNTVVSGVQHKYPRTVLLLCNEVCAGYCRYCFRKRLFMEENEEVSIDVSEGIEYIARNKQVTNVLLTGGDPLLMSTRRIEMILSQLREIPHLSIIRIGSKIPAFNPMRITEDPELLEVINKYSTSEKRIYIMTHFDHVRELTDEAVKCVNALIKTDAILYNQCPVIKGVNDNPVELGELFRKLSFIGCTPYYVFQGRPTKGNYPYRVSITSAYDVFEKAKTMISGLARTAKFVMSHSTGKIEVIAIDKEYIYLKYHRAKNPEEDGKLVICRRDDEAYWFDELKIVKITYPDG